MMTHILSGGGSRCDGMKIEKTAMFTRVMIAATVHFTREAVIRSETTTLRRLMMSCNMKWILYWSERMCRLSELERKQHTSNAQKNTAGVQLLDCRAGKEMRDGKINTYGQRRMWEHFCSSACALPSPKYAALSALTLEKGNDS